MKSLVTLILLLSLWNTSSAQSEEYINQVEVKDEIESSAGISKETLCGSKWVVNTSIMYLIYDNPNDNMVMDMEYSGTTYIFHLDGTFEIDAKLDSNGTWELRNNGRLLYLYNNLRHDEELQHILMDSDMMKWFLFEGKSTFYQVLDKS